MYDAASADKESNLMTDGGMSQIPTHMSEEYQKPKHVPVIYKSDFQLLRNWCKGRPLCTFDFGHREAIFVGALLIGFMPIGHNINPLHVTCRIWP